MVLESDYKCNQYTCFHPKHVRVTVSDLVIAAVKPSVASVIVTMCTPEGPVMNVEMDTMATQHVEVMDVHFRG